MSHTLTRSSRYPSTLPDLSFHKSASRKLMDSSHSSRSHSSHSSHSSNSVSFTSSFTPNLSTRRRAPVIELVGRDEIKGADLVVDGLNLFRAVVKPITGRSDANFKSIAEFEETLEVAYQFFKRNTPPNMNIHIVYKKIRLLDGGFSSIRKFLLSNPRFFLYIPKEEYVPEIYNGKRVLDKTGARMKTDKACDDRLAARLALKHNCSVLSNDNFDDVHDYWFLESNYQQFHKDPLSCNNQLQITKRDYSPTRPHLHKFRAF